MPCYVTRELALSSPFLDSEISRTLYCETFGATSNSNRNAATCGRARPAEYLGLSGNIKSAICPTIHIHPSMSPR